MPLLGQLLQAIGASIFGLIASLVGAKVAIRLTAVASLAAIYLSCVVYFTTIVGPWIGSIFATEYGALLGLLFPPVAGSVVASLGVYFTCVVGARYVSTLTKLAIG